MTEFGTAPIRAVSLDAHGTLIELPDPVGPLRLLLEQRFGVRVSVDQARDAFAAEVRFYRGHMLEGRDGPSVVALRHRCAEVLRASLPRTPGLAAVATPALAEVLIESLRFRLFPDVLPALRAMRAAGVQLAVASNWDASLGALLDRLGVGAALDGVVTSAAVGVAKPDARVIEMALSLMDTGPAGVLHVGDVYEEDVLGARAAGVSPILLLRRGGQAPPGVRTIRSLGELRNLVCRVE